MRAPHHPTIKTMERSWVVECPEYRRDMTSEVPIGIGMPLRDRLTAERLAENH